LTIAIFIAIIIASINGAAAMQTIRFTNLGEAELFCTNEHRTGNLSAVVRKDMFSTSERWYVFNARKQERQDDHITRRQYNQHVAEMRAVLDNGCYPSPDAYYAAKDRERDLAAKLAGTTSGKHDPMYFWFGRMSN
jgi:hypothetical protein